MNGSFGSLRSELFGACAQPAAMPSMAASESQPVVVVLEIVWARPTRTRTRTSNRSMAVGNNGGCLHAEGEPPMCTIRARPKTARCNRGRSGLGCGGAVGYGVGSVAPSRRSGWQGRLPHSPLPARSVWRLFLGLAMPGREIFLPGAALWEYCPALPLVLRGILPRNWRNIAPPKERKKIEKKLSEPFPISTISCSIHKHIANFSSSNKRFLPLRY